MKVRSEAIWLGAAYSGVPNKREGQVCFEWGGRFCLIRKIGVEHKGQNGLNGCKCVRTLDLKFFYSMTLNDCVITMSSFITVKKLEFFPQKPCYY